MRAILSPSALRALAKGDRMARIRRPLRGQVCPRCTRREQWQRCAICNPPPISLLLAEIFHGIRVRSGFRQISNRFMTALENASSRADLIWPLAPALEVPMARKGSA